MDSPPRDTGTRGRRRRWPWVLGALAFVGLWAALAADAILDARRHTDRGVAILEDAQADLETVDLLRGEGRDQLLAAQAEFRRAHDRANSLFVRPLKLLPFVGRQARSVESLTGAAEEVVAVGVRALDATAGEIERADPVGPGRVELARRLGAVADTAAGDLEGIELGPGEHLLGPLQRAHDRFNDEFDDLRAAVDDLSAAGHGVAAFLDGPVRYLVLAANNAEMRVGAGAFLSAGVLSVEDGRFMLGEMQPSDDLMPPPGSVPITDADFDARWGFMAPTDDFRELAASPRFDVVGSLALDMWEASRGERLDGVLVIDPIALRSLLEVTGPVTVEGTEYSAANVTSQIFLEQYLGLDDDPLLPDQIARRDRLSKIARAAIEALDTGGWDTLDLVEALRPAVGGRHVLAWSPQSVQQAGWSGAGIDGVVGPDELLVALHNRAGNKLDQFIEVEARLAVRPGEGDAALDVELTFTNGTPAGLPRYVAGPYPGTPGAADGKYQGWLVVELPGLARNSFIEVDGRRVPHVAIGADGPDHRVVAALVELDRGATRFARVHFELPAGETSLYVAPGARVPAIEWRSGERRFTDAAGHRVTWST
jgi:hypothetical protein